MKATRILLVEDNSDDEYLALLSIKKAGVHQVDVAHDGVEALEMLLGNDSRANGLPDLVILDLRLPKIDGLEVLESLRDNPYTTNVPVLILTSSEYPKDKEVCARLRVSSFVSKPLSTAKLLEVLSKNNLIDPEQEVN